MSVSDNYLIEPISPSDESLLWEMLYLAIYVPPGMTAPPRQIVNTPQLSRYVQGWGQANDYGLKVMTFDGAQPIGATWLRLMKDENRGYGYIDNQTPELSIAVLAEYRGKGIGTALLKQLLDRARKWYETVSLSVSAENPAIRLYERLGFELFSRDGASLIMRKRLTTSESNIE